MVSLTKLASVAVQGHGMQMICLQLWVTTTTMTCFC